MSSPLKNVRSKRKVSGVCWQQSESYVKGERYVDGVTERPKRHAAVEGEKRRTASAMGAGCEEFADLSWDRFGVVSMKSSIVATDIPRSVLVLVWNLVQDQTFAPIFRAAGEAMPAKTCFTIVGMQENAGIFSLMNRDVSTSGKDFHHSLAYAITNPQICVDYFSAALELFTTVVRMMDDPLIVFYVAAGFSKRMSTAMCTRARSVLSTARKLSSSPLILAGTVDENILGLLEPPMTGSLQQYTHIRNHVNAMSTVVQSLHDVAGLANPEMFPIAVDVYVHNNMISLGRIAHLDAATFSIVCQYWAPQREMPPMYRPRYRGYRQQLQVDLLHGDDCARRDARVMEGDDLTYLQTCTSALSVRPADDSMQTIDLPEDRTLLKTIQATVAKNGTVEFERSELGTFNPTLRFYVRWQFPVQLPALCFVYPTYLPVSVAIEDLPLNINTTLEAYERGFLVWSKVQSRWLHCTADCTTSSGVAPSAYNNIAVFYPM